MAEETELRTTTVTVSVREVVPTVQYGNIQIELSTSDQITWTSQSERATKTDNLGRLLAARYQENKAIIMGELGLAEKRAHGKASPAKPSLDGLDGLDGLDSVPVVKASPKTRKASNPSLDLGDDLLA